MIVFKRLIVLVSCLLISFSAFSAGPEVKSTDNLSKIGELAQKRSLPILLVFSASECAYCVVLENEFLRPMLLSGDYANKVIIRKIVTDEVGAVRDFRGRLISSGELIGKYNISVTPTMLFVDNRGKELVKRLIGVGTIDYFGGDLDSAIDRSLKKIRSAARPVDKRIASNSKP